MIPSTMKAAVLDESGVTVTSRDVPEPARGQVLVRMHRSPINPNDLMFLEDSYDIKKPLPVVPGFEGSGTVISSGGGLMGRFLIGRRVAVMATDDGDGTWAEYMCTDATKCAPLRADVSLERGAMLLTNPLTATVLVARARREGHGFVQNAAAGSLGRMIVKLALRAGIPLVNIVRRPQQAELLREIGAEHVIVSTAPDFGDELRDVCARLDLCFGIDAVAGAATGQMLAALKDGGRVMVYGMLSAKPCSVDPSELVFRNKVVYGFTMHEWAEKTSLLGQLRALRGAQSRLADDLASDIRATIPLEQIDSALELARGPTSEGKILIALGSDH